MIWTLFPSSNSLHISLKIKSINSMTFLSETRFFLPCLTHPSSVIFVAILLAILLNSRVVLILIRFYIFYLFHTVVCCLSWDDLVRDRRTSEILFHRGKQCAGTAP